MKKQDEYQELFLAEALDNYEELNRLLTELEKQSSNSSAIHALFRITHTLKGNAAGLGFTPIAELGHAVETLFGEIREQRIALDAAVFTALFKSVDILGALIHSVKDGKSVAYKGIKTKLEILCKQAKPAQSISNPTVLAEPVAEEVCDDKEASEPLNIAFSDLVQVPVRKLDNLLNLVGELTIERDRMMAAEAKSHRTNAFTRLNRISSDLQYSVMDVRLVQIGFLFKKFHRVVRDVATGENKQVALRLKGTDTEIDRSVLQTISDALIHLVRNAVAHGIELTETRQKADKPPEGTITLEASNENDAVVIRISDDGGGIDLQKVQQRAVQRQLISSAQIAQLSEEETVMLIFRAWVFNR